MKRILVLASLLGFGLAPLGCAHWDERRAEYHRERAERAMEHGHPYKAMREERKAHRAEWDAEHDPLP